VSMLEQMTASHRRLNRRSLAFSFASGLRLIEVIKEPMT